MLRFNANITSMYGNLSVSDALASAKADGFDAVECRSPFDEPAEVIAEKLSRHGMTMVQFNTPMGDFAAGERGIACIPGRETEFRESIELTLAYARQICPVQINCPGGKAVPDVPRADQERLLCENLAWAADRFSELGIRLQLEGINPVENPGVLVGTAEDAMRVIDMAGHPNLWLQYDFYHNQVTSGDLVGTFARYQERINHVQFADHPGRHEPGTGEINYRFVMSELERLDYRGWIGLEYAPTGAVSDGLVWLNEYKSAARQSAAP